jgi:GNAT superfamily N-acetyltransferase
MDKKHSNKTKSNPANEKAAYPLSREAEERVDQRSVVGVSQPGGHYRQCLAHGPTHPAIALLGIPLFAARKEGKSMFLIRIFHTHHFTKTYIMLITHRPATFEDISGLNKLIASSVRALSPGYYTPAQIESAIKYVFGVDTQLVIDHTYYVAEIDGQLAGCGGWSKRNTLYGGDQHKEIEDPLLDPATDAARIRAFFVHPDFARRGVGRYLIDVCENAARADGFKRIEMGATLPGVPLYAAVGYEAMERIDTTLADGEVLGIVRMGKNL